MRAMALVVCFCTGSGSVQEPVASSLAVCWNDILHVLGLRIVVLGCGGRQARGLSVAWLAQASPRVDVASPHQACQELRVFSGSLRPRCVHVISV